MNNFLTDETPGKVLGLLGASLVSLSFLFAVSMSNASFSAVYNPLPDPLAPQNVMAVLDNVSHDYAMFINTNLTVPAQQSYALAADNIAFIGQNASYEVASYFGQQDGLFTVKPMVAGAYTQVSNSH